MSWIHCYCLFVYISKHNTREYMWNAANSAQFQPVSKWENVDSFQDTWPGKLHFFVHFAHFHLSDSLIRFPFIIYFRTFCDLKTKYIMLLHTISGRRTELSLVRLCCLAAAYAAKLIHSLLRCCFECCSAIVMPHYANPFVSCDYAF